MMPAEHTRILRRERRRAWRGTPRGRHATRKVETTYGRGQRDRDWREAFSAFCARHPPAASGPGRGQRGG